MNKDLIVKKLLELKENYYKGNPTMSDSEFDELESKLYDLDPNNDYFKIIGTSIEEVEDGEKVTHDKSMRSMQKVKNAEDALKWIERIYDKNNISQKDRIIVVEPKIDGMSCTIRYDKNGDIMYAATRGNGRIGFKIDHLGEMIRKHIFPRQINNNLINLYCKEYNGGGVEIRGEIYVPKDYSVDTKRTSLRNIAVGIIRRKTDSQDIKFIKFIAYKIVLDGVELDPRQTSLLLDILNFNYVSRSTIDVKNISSEFMNYLNHNRDEYEYETDGLVLTMPYVDLYKTVDDSDKKYHWYQMALKPPSLGGMSIIDNITYNISKLGKLIPVANINPLSIGGVVIKNVTLNNVEYVEKNKIGKGCIVNVVRSNDVIPMITEVINEPGVVCEIPKNCMYCGSTLYKEGVDLYCSNVYCKKRLISEIDFFLDTIDCKGISIKTIESVVENNVSECEDVIDFCNIVLDINILKKIITGEKRIHNFSNSLLTALSNNASEINILKSLCIPNVGLAMLKGLGIDTFLKIEKSLSLLDDGVDDHGYVIWTTIFNWFRNEKNMNKYLKYKDYFKKYYKNIEEFNDVIDDINRIYVCITGKHDTYKRSDIEKIIKSKSHTPTSVVNKNVDYLIICDDIVSNKTKAAEKYGIKKIKLEDYIVL